MQEAVPIPPSRELISLFGCVYLDVCVEIGICVFVYLPVCVSVCLCVCIPGYVYDNVCMSVWASVGGRAHYCGCLPLSMIEQQEEKKQSPNSRRHLGGTA